MGHINLFAGPRRTVEFFRRAASMKGMDLEGFSEAVIFPTALTNLLGAAFGFFYYQGMFSLFPPYLWVFIPDSPFATFLFAIALLLIHRGRGNEGLNFLASIGVMKYGLWTLFVILFYPEYFLSPPVKGFYLLMFVLHFGMVVEPLLILPSTKPRRRVLCLTLGWFLLQDAVDYGIGTHPLIRFPFLETGTVAAFSIATTLLLVPLLAVLLWGYHRRTGREGKGYLYPPRRSEG
jgi:uncharacterized membrane protein YpjA